MNLLWEHNTSPNGSSSSSSEDQQPPLVHLQYGYDQASNRTYRKDLVATSYGKPFDELYTYDGLHRLKTFHRGQLTNDNRTIETPTLQQGWLLDATGNWRNFSQHNQEQPNQTLDQQRLHNRVNEITNIARTVGQNWATPAYDRNGNMTTIPQPANPTRTYKATYDAWNRLVRLEINDSSQSTSSSSSSAEPQVIEYAYDAQHRRITKANHHEARHYYSTSSWQCVEERVGSSILADRQFVWGRRYIDDLILRDRSVNDATSSSFSSSSSEDDASTERLYCLQDANWNVVAITDAAGYVMERYTYTAYGVPTVLDSAFNNLGASPHDWETRFAGYRWDHDAQIYPVRMRIYLAHLGVWAQEDPLGYVDGMNLHEALNSQPIDSVDPFGLTAEENEMRYEASLAGWAALCGILAHGIIEAQVVAANASAYFTRTNRTIRTTTALYGNGTATSSRRPDIVLIDRSSRQGNCSTGVIYEIKPRSPYGYRTGPTQVSAYVRLLVQGGVSVRPGHAHPGTTGGYPYTLAFTVPGCGLLGWASQGGGMIYYNWYPRPFKRPKAPVWTLIGRGGRQVDTAIAVTQAGAVVVAAVSIAGILFLTTGGSGAAPAATIIKTTVSAGSAGALAQLAAGVGGVMVDDGVYRQC